MTYAEFLAAQGASADEIKVLDVPVARKAWEASETARAAAQKESTDLRTWYNDQAVPAYKAMEAKMMTAQADAARNAALVQAATDQGLLEVAKNAGVKTEDLAKPAAPAFDASKYVTLEQATQFLEREGESIAIMGQLVQEDQLLFGLDHQVDWPALRRTAREKRTNLTQEWMEKYGVQAAREARAKAQRDAAEQKIRDDERSKVQAEFASRYGNPDARPLVPSRNPLAPRAESGRDKQPWETDEGSLTKNRVQRATETLVKSMTSQVRN